LKSILNNGPPASIKEMIPAPITAPDKYNPNKLYASFFDESHILSFFRPLRSANELKIVRVTKIAVNMDIIIPQNNTVAKPLMGPVPN